MPQCTKCYREFCKKKNLLRHMRTVHGEPQKEEHRCNCGKTFGRKDNLSKHKKNCKQANLTNTTTDTGSTYTTVMVKKAGEEIPWDSKHKLILLAPVAVCGLLVPSNWKSSMTCNRLGVNSHKFALETNQSFTENLNWISRQKLDI